MITYNIIIRNGGGYEIYNEVIIARSENDAIKMIIDNITLADGDTIEINEG